MAVTFRASNIVPQDAYNLAKRTALQLKTNLSSQRAALAAGSADYDFLRDIYLTLSRAKNGFDNLRTTPGLADYASSQENDPAYDVAAEFTSMLSSITSAMAWIEANVPTSVTVQPVTDWGAGSMISQTFTPAQTTGLRSVLDSVIATIS